jgi:hypothetical protein
MQLIDMYDTTLSAESTTVLLLLCLSIYMSLQALMEEGDALDEAVTEQRTAAAAKEKEVLFLITTNNVIVHTSNILSYKVLFLHCAVAVM